MEAGSRREVAVMAWPLAVGMLSFTMMGVVDTLLMGRVSTAAQAGVGLGTTLSFFAAAFFRGLLSGPQSLVAAADGAGDTDRQARAAGAALLLSVVTGVLASGVILVVLGPLLDWAVSDPAVALHCRRYLEVRALGVPLSLLAFGALGALQGLGDTRSRMWVSLAGNLLNVGLDLVLVFGLGPVPAMGEVGAAWATVASAGLMAGLYLLRARQRFGRVRWPGWEVLRSALSVGLPSGVQSQLNVVAFAVMNLALARVGARQLAASEVVLNLASVSFLPGFGVGEAGGVLVGRYLGAGRRAAAVRALRSARLLAVVVMGSCGLLFATEGGFLASFFSTDPKVVSLAGELMRFAASFQLFDAVATVHLCALRSAGDTRFTLLATTAAAWGLTVPGALVLGLGLGWGAPGAWLGLTLEVAALAGVTAWRVGGLGDGRVGRLDLLLGSGDA